MSTDSKWRWPKLPSDNVVLNVVGAILLFGVFVLIVLALVPACMAMDDWKYKPVRTVVNGGLYGFCAEEERGLNSSGDVIITKIKCRLIGKEGDHPVEFENRVKYVNDWFTVDPNEYIVKTPPYIFATRE